MSKLIKLSNEDNIKIWGDYLTHVDIKFNGYKPKIQNDSKHYAVIIEPRQHLNLALVMKSTMFHLNENESPIKWGLQIFKTPSKEFFQLSILPPKPQGAMRSANLKQKIIPQSSFECECLFIGVVIYSNYRHGLVHFLYQLFT